MHYWNVGWAPTADEWSALWAFCSLVVTIGAAALALIQLRAYFVERFESSRPYVMVDFEFRSEIILEVVVRNDSATPASEVKVLSEPAFKSTMHGREAVFAKITDSDYVIRHLGPGRKLRWTLDRAPDYFKETSMPRSYEVTVSYEDPRAPLRGPRWRPKPPKRFSETFTLSIDQYDEATADTDWENKNWNIAKRNEGRFDNLLTAVRSLANNAEAAEERSARMEARNRLRRRKRMRS
ncbi:hypothetical protein Q9Q99_12640 [Curtobacterium flaccumfaciens]|nr:hypothetical protein Q9Q99_12640 [Curtobacterium flaccumfaciens]